MPDLPVCVVEHTLHSCGTKALPLRRPIVLASDYHLARVSQWAPPHAPFSMQQQQQQCSQWKCNEHRLQTSLETLSEEAHSVVLCKEHHSPRRYICTRLQREAHLQQSQSPPAQFHTWVHSLSLSSLAGWQRQQVYEVTTVSRKMPLMGSQMLKKGEKGEKLQQQHTAQYTQRKIQFFLRNQCSYK